MTRTTYSVYWVLDVDLDKPLGRQLRGFSQDFDTEEEARQWLEAFKKNLKPNTELNQFTHIGKRTA